MHSTKHDPFIKSRSELTDTTQTERLEYYERQLIDMKIRLDALEIQGIEQKTDDPNLELKQFLEKLVKNEAQEPQVEKINGPKSMPEKTDSMRIMFLVWSTPTQYFMCCS